MSSMQAKVDVEELAALMQAAALEPTEWERALNAVNLFVEGNGAVLLSVQARQRVAPASTDLVEMIDDYFNLGWYAHDAREPCVPLLRTRGIVFDHEFQTADEIEGSAFYNDFLARHRRKWFVGIGASIGGDDWCLALQRAPDRDPFTSRDLEKLRLVRGLLCNAASLSAGLGRSWIEGLHQALHTVAQAAVVFDHRAQVLDANDLALAIIGDRIASDRQLRFDDGQAEFAFRSILTKATRIFEARMDEATCTIPFGEGTYMCRATNLLRHERLIASNAAILVTISPVATDMSYALRTSFDLTANEAQVAIAIWNGTNVRKIASERGVKADTIRTQLKSIYRKTCTSSQLQLATFMRELGARRPRRAPDDGNKLC